MTIDIQNKDVPAPRPKAAANPNAIAGISFDSSNTEVKLGPQTQGLIARFAFLLNTPKGWKAAFTFNMTTDDKADYSLKEGELSFVIPTQHRRPGRMYAILGLDNEGHVKLFNDTDKELIGSR